MNALDDRKARVADCCKHRAGSMGCNRTGRYTLLSVNVEQSQHIENRFGAAAKATVEVDTQDNRKYVEKSPDFFLFHRACIRHGVSDR